MFDAIEITTFGDGEPVFILPYSETVTSSSTMIDAGYRPSPPPPKDDCCEYCGTSKRYRDERGNCGACGAP